MSDFKGVWIPAKVWECKELSLMEKHFLCQIYLLDNENGCFASNSKFAEFFDISTARCSQVLKELEGKEFIKIELHRKGKEVVKRVVNLLNKGIKLFKEGSKFSKEGSKFSKEGIKDSKEGVLNFLKENKEEVNKEINKEKESIEKTALTLKDSEIEDLKKQLEAEKEKNKEKVAPKRKFPKQNSKPKAILTPRTETPPHKTDIEQESWNNQKEYEMAIQDYHFDGWSEKLIENFKEFCKVRYEKQEGKFYGTQAKLTIKEIEQDVSQHGIQKVENCLFLCAKGGWTYDIKYQINKESREKADELKRQKQKADDKSISTVELAMRDRFPEYFGEAERQAGSDTNDRKWYEQEF